MKHVKGIHKTRVYVSTNLRILQSNIGNVTGF